MTDFFEDVSSRVARMWECKDTVSGVRVRSLCFLPSFESLYVFVERCDDGFMVHDDGEAVGSMILHGMETAVADRVVRSECGRVGVGYGEGAVHVKIGALDGLEAAIVRVSNTAAAAASFATKVKPGDFGYGLADQVSKLLDTELGNRATSKGFGYRGASGRQYKFDLAVNGGDRLTLINTVAPSAASVNSNYVALADVVADGVQKIAAHGGGLRPEDISLLREVAVVAEPAELLGLVTDGTV